MARLEASCGCLPRSSTSTPTCRGRQNEITELARVADVCEGGALQVRGHGGNIQRFGVDYLHCLDAGPGQALGGRDKAIFRQRGSFVEVKAYALLLEPLLDLLTGKAPLTAHLEPGQAAIVEHPVDSDTIDLENFLELSGGEQVVHEVDCPP
jgi:hypothetical protein